MTPITAPEIEAYCARHSTPGNDLLRRLAEETQRDFSAPQMMVGDLEGAFLAFQARAIGARRILEIGTFTGCSALWLASALPPDGELVCVDRDPRAAAVAKRYLAEAGLGARVRFHVGPAREQLAQLDGRFDLVFLDADKGGYVEYLDWALPRLDRRGLVLADNVLWSGHVLDPKTEDDHALVRFAQRVDEDPGLERVMVPIRDGILMIRRRE
ncbi:MAG: O-methyltransferase [bacterium]